MNDFFGPTNPELPSPRNGDGKPDMPGIIDESGELRATEQLVESESRIEEGVSECSPIINSEYANSKIENMAWQGLQASTATPGRGYDLAERAYWQLLNAPIRRTAIAYLVGIILAEVITNLASPVAGVSLHFSVFTLSIIHGAVDSRNRAAALWLSFSLVPLIRVVSLGLPLGAFSQEWWYLLTGIPLLAGAVTAVRAAGFTWEQVGVCFPKSGQWLLTMVVAASGLAIGIGEYVILGPTATFDGQGLANLLLYASVFLIGTGLSEELIFRGVLQTAAIAALGLVPGFLLASALFALMHIGHGSALNVLYIFGVAMYLSYARNQTGSLLGVVVAHTLANIVLYVVMT